MGEGHVGFFELGVNPPESREASIGGMHGY